MADRQTENILELGNIRIAKDILSEVDRGRPIVRVPREDVQRVALRWGFLAPRPAVQALLGIGLLLAGGYFVSNAIQAQTRGGKVGIFLFAGLVAFTFLGIWLLFEAFRRGYYLEVQTRKVVEKLRFDRKYSRAEIDTLLESARSRHGWLIDSQSDRGLQGVVR
jgi:hypothetical protein